MICVSVLSLIVCVSMIFMFCLKRKPEVVEIRNSK